MYEKIGSGGSRRAFLGTTGMIAGGLTACGLWPVSAPGQVSCAAPVPLSRPEVPAKPYNFSAHAPTRRRKCLHEVAANSADLAKLTRAVGKLKDLMSNPADPLNWCNQANMHLKHCSDRSGNYLLVHFGWHFLPWHRAYLYFYESILGHLIDDPSFALPYWDWTTNPYVPPPFFDTGSPLHDRNRDISATSVVTPTSDPETYNVIRPESISYILTRPNFTTGPEGGTSFGGSPDRNQGSTGFQGLLEAGPHNAMHSWVGGDMGSFSTAARDILFFAHHANVDRLWNVWLSTKATPSHMNPTQPAWTDQWFNFFAPDGSAVSAKTSDLIDSAKVNVVYDPCHRPVPEAVAKPQPPKIEFDPLGPPMTVDAEVHRPARAVADAAGPYQGDEVQVRGVELPHELTLRLRVFIDKADADVNTSLDDPHYAGTIFVVGAGEGNMDGHDQPKGQDPHGIRNFILPVATKAASSLGRGDNKTKLTLVPVVKRSTVVKDAVPRGVTIKVKSASVIAGP